MAGRAPADGAQGDVPALAGERESVAGAKLNVGPAELERGRGREREEGCAAAASSLCQ